MSPRVGWCRCSSLVRRRFRGTIFATRRSDRWPRRCGRSSIRFARKRGHQGTEGAIRQTNWPAIYRSKQPHDPGLTVCCSGSEQKLAAADINWLQITEQRCVLFDAECEHLLRNRHHLMHRFSNVLLITLEQDDGAPAADELTGSPQDHRLRSLCIYLEKTHIIEVKGVQRPHFHTHASESELKTSIIEVRAVFVRKSNTRIRPVADHVLHRNLEAVLVTCC